MRRVPKILSLLFAGAAIMAVPAAAADSPRQFLQDALRGDNSEIMLGRMAQDRARSQAVRDFARTLVRDHAQSRNDVIRLGRPMGIVAHRDITNEAREMRDQLTYVRGREFDRIFINHMVDNHRQDVDAFRDEARERHGPVSDLAQRQLPTLQRHLEMAIALDRDGDRRGRDWNSRDGRDGNYRDGTYHDNYGRGENWRDR